MPRSSIYTWDMRHRGRRRLAGEAGRRVGSAFRSFAPRSSISPRPSSAMSGSIKFMTYNVWSCEHVAVYRRIKAICEIIEQHDPDVVFLQEVTDYIYSLFQEAPWWKIYYKKFSSKGKDQNYNNSSLPFDANPSSFCLMLSKLNAAEVVLPRYLDSVSVETPSPARFHHPSDLLSAWVYKKCMVTGNAEKRHRLRAATCSLAGPTLSDIGCVHRRARASAFLEHFDAVHQPHEYKMSFVLDGNVVLGGDMGWDDDLDGPLRLGDDGWLDAWLELRVGGVGDAGGWTYDAVANPMLRGLNFPAERRRSDRFICKLRDFRLVSIKMVGVDPIPGVTSFDDKGTFVPVLPSHHFGLLLTISPKE